MLSIYKKRFKGNLLLGIAILSILEWLPSCNSQQAKINKEISDTQNVVDSLKISHTADSMAMDLLKNIGKDDFDKAFSLSESCPIKIKKATLLTQEYSRNKGVSITFHNASDKPIDAIRFVIYGKNNWGEPEIINSIVGSAYGYCETQRKISPGKTLTQSWELNAGDVTKIQAAVMKAHFSNGELWDVATVH